MTVTQRNSDSADLPTDEFHDNSSDRDTRLAALLEKLITQAQAGDQPSVDEFAQQHPDLAVELRQLFATVNIADVVGNPAMVNPASSDPANSEVLNQTAADMDSSFFSTMQLPCNIGDYQLLEILGQGGMGVVYRAHQLSLDRDVALKMIAVSRLISTVDIARFHAEAEAVGQLDHSNIVPIYEVGEFNNHPFFSMKLIGGTTLSERLSNGPLQLQEAASMMKTLAEAIDYAHQRGVLHRDLKSSNIMLDSDGLPHVTDFGLAKRMNEDISLTRTGAVMGTPSFMAPEQAAPQRGKIDARTDIYSLGAILYQMLTGRPPFQAATAMDTMMLVLEQDPVLPHLINPKVDLDLEMITMRCLQKPAELRYQTASELASDLNAYLHDEPISARSYKVSEMLTRVFRDTHHAIVLENWGLVWMWHSLVLLFLCLCTNWFQWHQPLWPMMNEPWPYILLWSGGLAIWVPIFWQIRRRAGPITFVERQIAHVWAGSVIGSILLFFIEFMLGLPVLTLSPVLGVINGMVFVSKAGILSGEFYFYAAIMFLTAVIMAILQRADIHFGLAVYGVASALTFFIPGLKYYRQRERL